MTHVKKGGKTGCLEDMLGQEPASTDKACQSETEALSPYFRAPMPLVLVLFAHMLCSLTVPSATSACMQLLCNPALTPAPNLIPNPRENKVVDSG